MFHRRSAEATRRHTPPAVPVGATQFVKEVGLAGVPVMLKDCLASSSMWRIADCVWVSAESSGVSVKLAKVQDVMVREDAETATMRGIAREREREGDEGEMETVLKVRYPALMKKSGTEGGLSVILNEISLTSNSGRVVPLSVSRETIVNTPVTAGTAAMGRETG